MLIIGAGGLALQMVDSLIDQYKNDDLYFFDDVTPLNKLRLAKGFNIINELKSAEEYLRDKDNRFIIAVGGPSNRKSFYSKFKHFNGKVESLIDHSVFIGSIDTQIGEGTVVLRQSIIESTVLIGKGCLVNVNSIITHEVEIGDFCELGPGCKLLGKAKVGDQVFIGAGAIILPNVKIGSFSVIGAGSVVLDDIPEYSKVAGIPAKPIR